MKIYLSAKYSAQQDMRDIRDVIVESGRHTVVSRWLNEHEDVSTNREMELAASRDFTDVKLADLFILDTFDEDPRAGREVEFGMALGLGIEVWIVGPRRNIFHHLVPQFDSWLGVLDSLRRDA